MKTVSKERLEEIAALEVKTTSSGLRHAPGMVSTVGSFDVVMMARELLALREGDKQEPVAEIREDLNRLFIHIHSHADLKAGDRLYTAPPAPVVPDYMTIPMIREKLPHISFSEAAGYSAGWNACCAAMLHGAEQHQNAQKNVPENILDGWVKCSERMPEHGNGVWVWSETGSGYPVEAYFDGEWYRTLTDEPEYNVTHWMPLPAGPGKEG